MRQRIAVGWNPDQHALVPRRANPPKRLVFPLHHDVSDPIEIIGGRGKIPDASLSHRGHAAPGVAGHIADHRGVQGRADLRAKLSCKTKQPDQFLRAAKTRERVEIHAIERDCAFSHCRKKFFTLCGTKPVQQQVGGPKTLQIPNETRPFGIVRGAAGDRHAGEKGVDLLLFDRGLEFGVADVHVRVGQDINRQLTERRHRKSATSQDGVRSACEGDRPAPFLRGNGDGELLHLRIRHEAHRARRLLAHLNGGVDGLGVRIGDRHLEGLENPGVGARRNGKRHGVQRDCGRSGRDIAGREERDFRAANRGTTVGAQLGDLPAHATRGNRRPDRLEGDPAALVWMQNRQAADFLPGLVEKDQFGRRRWSHFCDPDGENQPVWWSCRNRIRRRCRFLCLRKNTRSWDFHRLSFRPARPA